MNYERRQSTVPSIGDGDTALCGVDAAHASHTHSTLETDCHLYSEEISSTSMSH